MLITLEKKDAIETWDGPIAKTSVDNGLYYGLGAGIEYNKFFYLKLCIR